MRWIAVGLAMALIAGAGAGRAAPVCAPAGSERAVENAVRAWFDAGRRDDLAALGAIQAPGFYAYDNGKRYAGLTLGELVKAAHASGTQIEWNLHDFDVHLGCDQAWAAWVNTGAVGTRGAMAPVTWLESATFAWRDGGWRMAFLHSGRVTPDAAPQNPGQNQGRRGRR
ncbi:nuclear transport factor 2 family protein [Phenylobacterium sp.]|jgi:hypothetical protein|uniref:nuclear transport factor 2 family protein n=1 Tax=Phenylobacterium sp. TaxID=1871053 RepID=UPI002F40E9C2